MKKMLNKSGLSMVELLVVLFILAVFAGLIIPVTTKARNAIKVTRTKAHMTQIAILLDLYYADFSRYPPTLESLDAIGIDPDTLPRDAFNPNDDFFQYFTNKYPYKGSTYALGQLFLLSSYAPDKDDDVEEERLTNNSWPGFLFPDNSYSLDSSVYEFYETGSALNEGNYTIDASTHPGYQDGDLLLFGPRQPKGLKEVDYGFGPGFQTWEELGF